MEPKSNSGQRIKKYLRRLQLIHLALVGGMVFMGILAYILQKSPIAAFPMGEQLMVYLVPLTGLVGYFGGILLFRKLMTPIEADNALEVKLARYQTASLLHYACLEAPALLALLAYIGQGYLLYAAIALFLIIYLYALRPTQAKLLGQLPLTRLEKEQLKHISG